MIAPPRLRPGDRVGVVAPSGPVLRRLVEKGARALEREGFRVVLGRHVFDRRGHLAGEDGARAEDFNRMLRNPDIRCVLMARGGYGAMRIAESVEWGAMRRDPKIFAGFSDATFFHLGFARHAGVRTLHGPNLHGFAGPRGGSLKRWIAWATQPAPPEAIRSLRAPIRLAGGRAVPRGTVFGGNLTLLDHAIGTRVMPSLRGSILFLEEVNEPPYKIDGMLCHLRLSKVLVGIRAVALGDFYRCKPKPRRPELPLREVLEDYVRALRVPALAGIKAGHARRNLPFPLGARALLDARRGRIVFEQGLVS
ncbi:MAG TPA: LD-carboxypeptidase [Candidatus Eisenbacteria bacterium]